MNYEIINDSFNPDFELSLLEKRLFEKFEDMLEKKGFKYLYVPSIIKLSTIEKQNYVSSSLSIDEKHYLSGSAEQGILQYFENKKVDNVFIYSKNTCFRSEPYYNKIRLMEFNKLEQFCFCYAEFAEINFDLLLFNSIEFLNNYNIKNRIIDVSKRDFGYHKKKYDIEVYSNEFGWIETHSCSYFGEEQTKRFNITGATHTISNTGIASPRILIPFIENGIFVL
jgi:seryl-tRNA synthetase